MHRSFCMFAGSRLKLLNRFKSKRSLYNNRKKNKELCVFDAGGFKCVGKKDFRLILVKRSPNTYKNAAAKGNI